MWLTARATLYSGVCPRRVMPKLLALRIAFIAVSQGSWNDGAWALKPIGTRLDTIRRNEPLLAELYSASISGHVATGPRAGRRVARVGDAVDFEDAVPASGVLCASVAGFSVHAGVCVPPRDRVRLERLARYAGRPPLATERLSLLPDGRLLYRLKHRWRDGTSHVIYEPLELVGTARSARASAEVQCHQVLRGA